MLDDPVSDNPTVYIQVYSPGGAARNPGRSDPALNGKKIGCKFYFVKIVFDIFSQYIQDPAHIIGSSRPVFNLFAVVSQPELNIGPSQSHA